MAVLTTLNITEKNANNSLSVTVKVNVTKEGVLTTTLSKEDVDKIHSYGIKLPTNRLGNEGYFNSTSFSDLVSQIREVLKRCLSYKIVEEVPVIKYQLEKRGGGMNKRLRNAIKKAENKQNEADIALQSICKYLAFSGFKDDNEPILSMASGNEIILEWNCSEMDANEIIDCMESAGYITPDDFIGVLD